MRRAVFLSLFFIILQSGFAFAQTVSVRTGVHDTYNRIVLNWPDLPRYRLRQDGTSVQISFDAPAAIDVSAVDVSSLPYITAMTKASGQGENLTVSLKLAGDSRIRDFKIGNRFVLDVYTPAGGVPETVQIRETVPKTPSSETPPSETPSPEEKPKEEVQEQQRPQTQKSTELLNQLAEDEDQVTVEVVAAPLEAPAVDPHVVTITSTKNLKVAAFTRAPYFWVVVADPELAVAPQVSGPNPDFFADVRRYDVPGGIAYRYPLPQGSKVYAEGGGLLWRLVVTPNPRDVGGIKPVREIDTASKYRGGSIVFPLNTNFQVLQVEDPDYKDQMAVIAVDESALHPDRVYRYPEMTFLDNAAGFSFIPRSDNISVRRNAKGIEIGSPAGLVLSRNRDIRAIELKEGLQADTQTSADGEDSSKVPLIYRFQNWEMGGLQAFNENQTILMSGMSNQPESKQVEDLVTLAKLALSNDRSYESLGYLKVARDTYPQIEDSPEYKAIRGAANALAGRYTESIEDLVEEALNPYDEIGYWKSYTLAGLEDWQQAASVLPEDFAALTDYPMPIQKQLALRLTEVVLRNGDTDTAQGLLGMLQPHKETMTLPHTSAWAYLMGETQRQLGDTGKAEEYWTPLVQGKDDLHRAKAGLSLTRSQLEENKITADEAINRLEGLRYAWRGDELETLINYRLGQVYLENNNYLKGLSVLRNAVSLSPRSPMGREVAAFMTQAYRDLFMTDALDEVSSLDAVTIYEEFKELTPSGEEGDVFVQRLAERLVNADLLERAASLLDHQVTHRLNGAQKVNTAIRLAAIRLLDGKPQGALGALETAQSTLNNMPPAEAGALADQRGRDMLLLRARALSKMNKAQEALDLLSTIQRDVIVNRLIADIAWSSGRWDEAADAFQDLILAEDISLTRPLTNYQTDLILNRAIGLNLSGNRVALANLRERYGNSMKQTVKAQLFDVVTRPRQLGLLSSRESVESLISEVDLFEDFLSSYRTLQEAQ